MVKTVLSVDGLVCDMCDAHMNDAIRKAFKVKKVTTSHTKGETVIITENELTRRDIEKAISETNRRRKIQMQYNEEHGIVPQTINKSIRDTIKASIVEEAQEEYKLDKDVSIEELINKMTDEMLEYAAKMEFEKAAELRDKIKELDNMYS